MKVLGINGKEYQWNLVSKPRKNASKLHIKARNLILEIYSTEQILEELFIPSTKLFADFYIPRIKTMIEVDGPQHDRYISHFHQNAMGMIRMLARDKLKIKFCEINNITMIRLKAGQTEDEWRRALNC